MDRKVVWTKEGLESKLKILIYWVNHNKSNIYSKKLNKVFKSSMRGIARFPSLGKPTKREGIKYIIVGNYLMFYKDSVETIEVLLIWDTRQDPNRLKFEL